MPLYQILYAIPLTSTQKDSLAAAITTIHSRKFTTPKNFVNVNFTDVSTAEHYIGGKRHNANHIRANVRAGPSRTPEDWEELCKAINSAWEDIVVRDPVPRPKGKQLGEEELKLRSLIVLGGIIGGLEAGFVLPQAGGDVQWLQENWSEFERRAANGEQEWVDVVQDVKERGLLDGTNGYRTEQQKLEEMLGWGDSA